MKRKQLLGLIRLSVADGDYRTATPMKILSVRYRSGKSGIVCYFPKNEPAVEVAYLF